MIDPNERWQTIVKTTGILSSQHNKQHHEMNVRSENGFVGSRSGVDGRIVQGSRVPAPAEKSTRQSTTSISRSHIQNRQHGGGRPQQQRTKRTAVPKSQTEHIRPASSSSSSARRSAGAPAGGVASSSRMKASEKLALCPRSRSLDDINDPRIFYVGNKLNVVEDFYHESHGEEDPHTATTASVRSSASSSQDRSRKSSLGPNSRKSADSSRSSASVHVGRTRRAPHPPLPRDQEQKVPDASRSAPSMLMSHQPLPSGAASVQSRGSRASSRRSAPLMSSCRRLARPSSNAGGPTPTVDSIRLRARQQQQASIRLKHSQQSMDDFRPPGLDDQPMSERRQHVNYSAPTKAANGDEGHLEALKNHEGPSGGTVPRPITRAASRGRGRGRRDYYQDNDDDELMKRSHRSLGRSRSRSVGRRARKEQRRAEREKRAERMMRRRASSMSRRRSSKDDVTDESLSDDKEDPKISDIHPNEEAVVSSGSTLATSNYVNDNSPQLTTKPLAEAYLSLPGDDSSVDDREWQVDKLHPSLSAALVDFSTDNVDRYKATTESEAGSVDMNDLQKRLMGLAAGRNRRTESNYAYGNTGSPKQDISRHHDALQNSFASVVAIEDIDEDVFSSRHAENAISPSSTGRQRNERCNSFHSSASTTEGALDGSLHFDGERIEYKGNKKYQSSQRCVLEDPFGLLDPDDVISNSEQFKTADGWVKRNYEGGKAA